MSPLIQLSDVTIGRGGRPLLAGLDLSVLPGDLVWVRGPNGSGKSSLLRAIAGFIRPDAGTLMTAATLGYLGHRDGFDPSAKCADEWDFWVGGTDGPALPHRVSQMSEGQRKRMALARLIAAKSKLLLLDEPYAALDADGAAELDTRLTHHLRSGGAAIVVSHQGLRDLGHDAKLVTLS